MDNGYIDFFAQQNYAKKQQEKQEIRKLGLLTGGALISFVILQNVLFYVLVLFGLQNKYFSDPIFQTGIEIIFSVLSILLPFMFFGKAIKSQTAMTTIVPCGKPNDRVLSALAIPAGLGICMAANIISSIFVTIMQATGYELSSPDIANPQGIFGFIVSLTRVSVAAAMIEEIAFRGYAMQPLRKYGDFFAIAMSACTFGLMHGNLIQAPFALIAGIGLGYICVKTNSIWPSIIVHCLNNSISITVSYLLGSGIISDNALNFAYGTIVYALIIIGVPALIAFVKRSNNISPTYNGSSLLTAGEKALAYITNPTMILAIIYMLFTTAKFVTRR